MQDIVKRHAAPSAQVKEANALGKETTVEEA